MLLTDLFLNHIDNLHNLNRETSTIEDHISKLQRFVKWFDNHKVKDITANDMEIYKADLIKSYATPIAYVVDVENGSFINETKVILCNEFYSMTTRKHQAKIRELYQGCAIGEFDLGGFYKRAEIDGVNVKGGVNY